MFYVYDFVLFGLLLILFCVGLSFDFIILVGWSCSLGLVGFLAWVWVFYLLLLVSLVCIV